jgi:RimJ/RimL family protein N-acetyltransferase
MRYRSRVPPAILETARLTLREMALDDLDFLAEMLSDPEVMRYYPRPYDRAGAEAWIQRMRERYAHHGCGFWLAVERATGRPIGQVGLLAQRIDGADEHEVAYMIHRPFQRRGFAAEAAAAARDHAFHAFAAPRAISLIRPENTPSQAVAHRIGMTVAGRTLHAGLEHLVFAVAAP